MATACSTPSSHSPATVSTPFQFASAGEANSYRLKAIVERLNFIMSTSKGGIRFDSSEFFGLCFALARGVDYALTVNDVPAVSYRLPSLIKEVYTRRKEISLQPAIMVLMISVKNACKSGWFPSSDADDLLSMTNELFSSFCMKMNVTPGVINALDIIPKVISRFYPQLKFCSLIVSFEVKPGYEVLMSDFQIPRNVSPEEKIKLLVVQADNLETSSCLISPAQVSFMVNGKAVDRRTNVSMDTGPQFPTDITKMLKYGTNILQAIGYFSGTYLIALAFMSIMVPFHAPALKDYVQPVISTASADPEIIEGASRITLNCPISFRRIKTPVKGHLCKHHQCFDYGNFIEMNTRKPSWRCPFCNQPVSFIDLRIDQHMVKVLKEVGEDVTDIVISVDGSWKAVAGQNRSIDQLAGENQGPQGCSSGGNTVSRSASTLADAVDLTMGEDYPANSPSNMEHLNGYISQNQNHACETEDIKPFRETHSIHKFSSEPMLAIYPSMNSQPSSSPGNDFWPRTLPLSSASNLSLANTSADARVGGTSATVLPSFLVNPATTNAVSPALNQEPLLSLETSQLNCSYQQLPGERSLAENMQLHTRFGNLMVSQEADRLLIPRHVHRNPIAVQALPVPAAQPPSTFKRMRITGPNLDGQNAATGDTEVQELRTSGLSMPQDSGDQNHQDINRSAMQYLSGLTSLIPVNTRLSSSLQRGAGAYRVNPQASSDTRMSTDGHNNLSNLRTPQASLILPSTFRSATTLPPAATRELARQVTQQKVSPHSGAILNHPPSRMAAAAPATGGEPSRNVAELPPENWRPTGRMRGSLTGSAYSAALSHYLAPGQPAPSRPVAQPVQLINSAATVGARGAVAHQAASGQNDGRSQPGGSSN